MAKFRTMKKISLRNWSFDMMQLPSKGHIFLISAPNHTRALQYLTITRPDIAHAVNSVSQFLHAPTIDHFFAIKRILRYVKGTLHFGLTFRPSTIPSALVAYSDADWAGCLDTRRSTSGYSIYLGNNLVSWSAKKQPTVSRSSCESEYRALAMTAAELLWLTHLLHDLKVPIPQQPLLLCDNKSAIFFSSNPVSHKRAKHVELDYHFLRELIVAGKLRTQVSSVILGVVSALRANNASFGSFDVLTDEEIRQERNSLGHPFGIPSNTMLEDGGLVQHLQVSFPKELLGTEIQSVGSGFGIVYKVTLMRMLELGSLSVAVEVSSKREFYSTLGVLQA
ncbi:Retrovirus-related Pol polyprotein from transposon RE2 [Vitis vinifera]|uniref:Retrovirus-related Pol polyprotein from transposon RE2 n=1 Tax=Vitis vinifera TaxID=29760 RepID=A0A438FRA4_VITVI|nr:Retrovirus-related Pol polyprotein from transposon RE2 [Vitis vinifera]